MKHLGDITKINGAEVEPVEVVIGGSPCQDLSVAGKRAGLDGERSGLFMEQIRIIKEMRKNDRANGRTDDAIRPRYMVWENVPGAFSSNKGEDFRIVLEETAKVADPEISIPRPPQGKWTNAGAIMGNGFSIAWRVLDAQYFGVPQRRRRIALVADFAGGAAPEILFERESVSGHSESCEAARQGTAGDAADCTGTASGVKCLNPHDSQSARVYDANGVWHSLNANSNGGQSRDAVRYPINTMLATRGKALGRGTGFGVGDDGDAQFTLSTAHEHAVCYGICSDKSNSMLSGNPHSGVYEADTSRTLDNNGGNPACNQGGMAILYDAYQHHGYRVGETCNTLTAGQNDSCRGDTPLVQSAGFKGGQSSGGIGYAYEQSPTLQATPSALEPTVVCLEGNGSRESHKGNGQMCNMSMKPIANSLDTMHDQQAVMTWGLDRAAYNQGKNAKYNFSIEQEKIGAQVAKGPGAVATQSVVRRLTPLECERLQGYPDGWTDIGEWTDSKGKKHKDADSPRYKALGNSIAIPCWRFILQRISERVKEHTMASLFDGIGGFPLIWEQINGARSCRWVSEIEEFPIAVTKMRFEQEE